MILLKTSFSLYQKELKGCLCNKTFEREYLIFNNSWNGVTFFNMFYNFIHSRSDISIYILKHCVFMSDNYLHVCVTNYLYIQF